MYKYKIKEILEDMTVVEYKIMVKVLPKVLDIAHNTFYNYMKLDINDKRDIPYTVIVKCEKILGVKPGELANFPITVPHYSSLVTDNRKIEV